MIQIKKGYTIKVTSWENDADNYNTREITVDTKEEAEMYYNMMQLFKSKNNKPEGVIKLGNVFEHGDFSENQQELILEFIEQNPSLLKEENVKDADKEEVIDWFMDIAFTLIGGGEFYSRVMKSCVITYSDKDIETKEIKF